jgi:transposase-like protein
LSSPFTVDVTPLAGIVTLIGSGSPAYDRRDCRHEVSARPRYRHRFPAEIISHAVWLYHVFSLSLRDVELLLAERGIVVSYETVRRWCQKFGESFAKRLRRRRPQPGDKWHLDGVSRTHF